MYLACHNLMLIFFLLGGIGSHSRGAWCHSDLSLWRFLPSPFLYFHCCFLQAIIAFHYFICIHFFFLYLSYPNLPLICSVHTCHSHRPIVQYRSCHLKHHHPLPWSFSQLWLSSIHLPYFSDPRGCQIRDWSCTKGLSFSCLFGWELLG